MERNFLIALRAAACGALVIWVAAAACLAMAQDTSMKETSNMTLDEAWKQYHERAEELRQLTIATPRFRERQDHRARGYHALLEAQAMAYQLAVAPRTEHPVIHTRAWFADVFTLGGNSPDFYYGAVLLDGRRSYRVTGRYGDLRLILLQGYSHLIGHPQSKLLGNFDVSELDVGDDGTFEVMLSARRHAGNWIPLDPESRLNFFFVRRALADWNQDRGDLRIEALDAAEPYSDLDEALQAERILLAADVMSYLVKQWNIGIYDLYMRTNDDRANRLRVIGGKEIAEKYMGSPSTYYMWGVYRVEDDEALIIEYDVPRARYWSFQLFDVWCKPLDFVNHQTDVNLDRAAIDADGKVRFVVAQRDPGVANWLDAVGRREGTLVGRNYLAEVAPSDPVVKLVKLAELSEHLPPDTRRVTPQERAEALEYRRRSYWKMYDEER